jgi:hypothetical protein
MVRVLTGLAAWLAGTALAVCLAWFGAGMVVRNTGMSPSMPVISAGPASPSPGVAAGPRAPGGRDSGPRMAAGAPSPSPSARSARSATTAAAADGTVRGYTLAGGRVTLLETRSSAELVTAIPDAGYSVQTWSGTGWLRVDFSSGPQVSSLIASWYGHSLSVIVTN